MILKGFCDTCSRTYPASYGTCIHCGGSLRMLPSLGQEEPTRAARKVALGPAEAASYPFVAEAKTEIAGLNVASLTDAIIERAVRRLEGAIAGLYDVELIAEGQTELLTFVAQLFIVKLVGIDALVRRFALAEARRTEQFLRADMRKTGKRGREIAKQLLEHEFSISLSEVSARRKSAGDKNGKTSLIAVDLVDYLLHTSTLRSKEWALTERIVQDGKVYLRDREVVRLVRHQLQVQLILRVRAMAKPQTEGLPAKLLEAVDQVRAQHAAKFEQGVMVLPATLPPCIRHIIDMMTVRHENVSHAGRILLATYMAANGRPADEICSLFKGAPDYNEAMTRKNVEYLAGQNSQGRAYHVKGCERVKADGFCYPDAGCAGLTHPLQYGREKK